MAQLLQKSRVQMHHL
ncbi:hypothetical protein Celaphus_00012011 [Cervus elaphus hippelaphus]|uniref:Uncharacterized protein n=1 Tax=Cervus elaphus hippelaphus TaxID=46360 RepID=A0A212CL43_CEREH|nr:hypothetical protein Celaphus_00012011 [Cervus elaphus hippelaphus]